MNNYVQPPRGSASVDVSAELDRFRQRLLDLSNTNRLLNYRKSATRTIQIVDELPNEIFDRLVVKEKPFGFLPAEESTETPATSDIATTASNTNGNGNTHELPAPPSDDSPNFRRHVDDKLQTDLTETRLDRVLTHLRQEANAAIEETGVNYLFLALGMLEWREREDSERVFLSPLILIPVRLNRTFDGRANKYQVTISYSGEDIQQNLSLARRIENDFGIVLPEYRPDEDEKLLLPEAYFSLVASAIVNKTDWKIKREALIGFFSFRKLLMYLDLDSTRWQGESSPNNHPLVRAVVEGSQLDEVPEFYGKDYDIDDHPTAGDIVLVKDADSSQHSALCDIAEGRSLVIEGPPGTGKSQTITNAIANALSQGKSVLFVAEKLAALEVVRGNLEKVGLGTFCLALHSDAANPRDVFADLGRRLNTEITTSRNITSLHSRISAQKYKLQRYLAACRLPTGPHGKPLYEVFWRITELRSRGVKALTGLVLNTSISESQFEDAKAVLNELAAHTKELGAPKESPWCGFMANQLPPMGHRVVADQISQLLRVANEIVDSTAGLQSRFGGDLRSWILLAGQLAPELLNKLMVPANLDRSLLPFLENIDQCKTAVAAAKEVSETQQVLQNASQLIIGELAHIGKNATDVCILIEKSIPKPLWLLTLAAVRGLRSQLETAIQAFRVFDSLVGAVTKLGFGEVQTLRGFEEVLLKYRLVSHPAVSPPNLLIEPYFLAGAIAAFQRGRKTSVTLQQEKNKLDEYFYLMKCPEADSLENLVDIFQVHGSSWTRFFHTQYRRARKQLDLFAKPAPRKNRIVKWISVLKELRQFQRESQEFVKDNELTRYFSQAFQGLETDWKSIEVSLNWVHTAKKAGIGFQQAIKLVNSRWNDSTAPVPSDLIAAGKDLRRELAQTGVLAALSLNKDSVEIAPLSTMQAYLVELAHVLDRLNTLRSSFSMADSFTLEQLCGYAADVIGALDRADKLQHHTIYCTAFPQHFAGVDTKADILAATAQWILALHELGLFTDTIQRIAADNTTHELQTFTQHFTHLQKLLSSWDDSRNRLAAFGTLNTNWLMLPGPAADVALCERLQSLERNLPHLPPWAGFCRALDRCRALGVEDFATAIHNGDLGADGASDCFDLTLHEQLATESFQAHESLSNFSRHAAEHIRSEFQQLDRQLIEFNQQTVAERASRREIPLGNSTGRIAELTELGLIRHEVGKQRRHCRIRDLIQRAGHAVQGLKPCWMMSPLSIAQYLPAGHLNFDLVVMDEASQIKPEDALGTLIRAKQIVIVGDPKQLPPTSFFDRISETDENEDSTFLDDSESILEVSLKAFPHRRRLRWHYRSQHESLIAFSNEKFYDGDLVVFPSPTLASGRLGILFHNVENSSFVGGCNPIEADYVAQAIVRHAIEWPDETLGVAAFNAKQAEAIRDRLDAIASENSEARLALDRLSGHRDKLFVKSLENVQGDERDVIFISYTYGPDPATHIVMNRFGPMTGADGWRRLNVLVTRAKRRIEVFSSMTPEQIKGGPDKSRGVNAMKDYLHYAMSGLLVDRGSATGREPDSPFEISVARVVEQLGLKVVPQVGVAGYFVDLGVLIPNSCHEFLLGIECDGATYHSSKSARDRDRLREEVITSRGWRLHRIWSTDWFLNQEAEELRLQSVIQRELARCNGY